MHILGGFAEKAAEDELRHSAPHIEKMSQKPEQVQHEICDCFAEKAAKENLRDDASHMNASSQCGHLRRMRSHGSARW